MYAQEKIKPYSDSTSKSEQVEQMFDNIAPTYDALNHILSLGIDRLWRKKAMNYLKKQGGARRILDVATGTGDFAILACKIIHPKKIVGIDISEKMLEIGKQKVQKSGMSEVIKFQKEDCASLSFEDNSFDCVISSFALRNFADLDQSLLEMHRVLNPGGRIIVIDLCKPDRFPMKQLFWCYQKAIMPLIGKKVSHDDKAYSYLPNTMAAIPKGKEMSTIFSKAGFKETGYKRLSFQMCMMYYGKK